MIQGLRDISMGAKLLIGLAPLIAVNACSDSQATAPDMSVPITITADVVVDPLDPNTEVHTFDELSPTCSLHDILPNPYEGLQFESTPHFAPCNGVGTNTTIVIVPADLSVAGTVQQPRITEILIDLPKPAVAASIDVYDYWTDRDLTLNAYDGSGNLVGSATDPTDFEWVTLSVTGDIAKLGIASDQANTLLDNLSITYAPDEVPGPGGDPADADACKKGGWSEFGFRNQGQCVRFVETGKDSR